MAYVQILLNEKLSPGIKKFVLRFDLLCKQAPNLKVCKNKELKIPLNCDILCSLLFGGIYEICNTK